MNRTVIIMAKVPRAGNVKTRLQPFLSADRCRTLAEAFLCDAINKARNLCDRLIIAFAPASEKDYFADVQIENLTLIEQRGADLGEKMSDAFEFAFRRNSDASVVLIGTDSPTFPPQYIEKALANLKSEAQTVLGKSVDGGFYLIGLRSNPPRLFENIEWSSPFVYRQMTRNIKELELPSALLPEWFDVDEPDDLRRLREEVLNDARVQKIAPHTFRWLTANADSF